MTNLRQKHLPKALGALMLSVIFVVAIALLWRLTPLNQLRDLDTALEIVGTVSHNWYAPLLMVTGFVIGSAFLFPLVIQLIVCILVFGAVKGGVIAMLGLLISAASGYAVGMALKLPPPKLGTRLHALREKTAQGGLLPMVLIRVIPVAPFVMVNIAVGAFALPFRHFILGTFIGFLPGTVTIGLFTESAIQFIRSPSSVTSVLLVAGIVATLALVALLKWLFKKDSKAWQIPPILVFRNKR